MLNFDEKHRMAVEMHQEEDGKVDPFPGRTLGLRRDFISNIGEEVCEKSCPWTVEDRLVTGRLSHITEDRGIECVVYIFRPRVRSFSHWTETERD